MYFVQITSLSVAWIRRWGGAGLFALGLLDNSFIPIPGGLDLCTAVLAGTHKNLWFYYAMMSTAGSVAGGYLIYRVARKGGKEALEQRFPRKKLDRVDRLFEKWGFGTVFISAILPPPFPTVPFLAGAGALNYPTKKFVTALAIARFVRYTALAYFASIYGRQVLTLMQHVHGGLSVALTILAAVMLCAAAAAIYLVHRRSRRVA